MRRRQVSFYEQDDEPQDIEDEYQEERDIEEGAGEVEYHHDDYAPRQFAPQGAQFAPREEYHEPEPEPHDNRPDYMRDPDYIFFEECVHEAVKILETNGKSCKPDAVRRALMFIVRKWQHHRNIFRRATRERFWGKNKMNITGRILSPSDHV